MNKIMNSKEHTVEDLCAVVELFEKGRIEPKKLISEVISFSCYDKAVERIINKEAIKVLLKWE